MKNKKPIFLVTGFLGCGKTSFLSNFLKRYDREKKIAVIQNEFAPSSIDSEILTSDGGSFHLEELHTGSIFCQCLFPTFKNVLLELSSRNVDAVLVETSGIADPIAIALLLQDKNLAEQYYVAQVISILDAPRFLEVLVRIKSVFHQIQIADTILINKKDLVDNKKIEAIKNELTKINPLAKQLIVSHASLDFDKTIFWNGVEPLFKKENIKGILTVPGTYKYESAVFKTVKGIKPKSLEQFLSSLDENILRCKGYVCMENGENILLQYVPGQLEQTSYTGSVDQTELIAIGYKKPNFKLLEESK